MKKSNSRALLVTLFAIMTVTQPCLAVGTGTTGQASLTLDEALRLTRENNPRSLQATHEVRAAEARVTESRSGYFPQLSAKAGYTHVDPVSEMGIIPGEPMIKFMPNDNYDAKVTAEMMLLDFGRTAREVDLARSGRNAAGIRRDLTVRDLSLATVRAFYSVMFLQEAVKVKDKEIAALQKNLDHMQKRHQEGTATRFDLLTTQVRLASAGNNRIELQSRLENNLISLRRLCGLKEHSPVVLKGSFDIATADADLAKLTESALENRPEILLTRENEKAASYKKSLAAKEGLPKIVGAASWGTANGYEPDIEAMRNNFAAGVQLKIPLFTGFRTKASTSEAISMMHAAEQERIDTEEMAQAEVKQSLNSLHTSRDKIDTTAIQVSQADLAAQYARIRYQNGLGTTLDLLDAESSLAQAELANLLARYEYVLNTYDVRRASGDLIAH